MLADVRFTPKSGQIAGVSHMSALCQKRTPAPQQNAPLFDHLVGAGEQLSNVAGIRANLTLCISQAVP